MRNGLDLTGDIMAVQEHQASSVERFIAPSLGRSLGLICLLEEP